MTNKFFLLFLIIFSGLFSCLDDKKNTSAEITHKVTIDSNLANRAKQRIDSTKQFLKNGCVVLRRGNDVISKLFTEFNKQDKSYSHCGVAVVDSGVWYVYHSIGGEDNPDAKLRKDTYENFVSIRDNFGFGICDFHFNETETSSLLQVVDSFFKKQIPFDMQFDLNSNDRLYCAEMVYKSIQIASKNDTFFNISNHNGFKYVSTDNIFVNPHAHIICQVKY